MLRVADEPSPRHRAILPRRNALRCRDTMFACSARLRGESLPLTAAELALVMTVPADRWLTTAELDHRAGGCTARACSTSRDAASFWPIQRRTSGTTWWRANRSLKRCSGTTWQPSTTRIRAGRAWSDGEVRAEARRRRRATRSSRSLRQIRGDPPPHFVHRSMRGSARRCAFRHWTVRSSRCFSRAARRAHIGLQQPLPSRLPSS